MSTAPLDLPPEIWLEIFRYATHIPRTISRQDPFVPDYISKNVMGANTPFSSMRTKCDLVLVSRSWRRVATELLYEHIDIRSARRAEQILATLQGVPQTGVTASPSDYGQWTRSIEVHTHARGAKTVRYLNCVFRIFLCCPNVRILSGNWVCIPLGFLEGLSRLYGQTLESLLWNEQNSLHSAIKLATPEFLASFRSLRVLDIRHVVGSDLSSDSIPPTLPHVTELLLSDSIYSLAMASALDLPAFGRLSLEIVGALGSLRSSIRDAVTDFLRIHGPKIKQLEVLSSRQGSWAINAGMFLQPETCPNLRDLVFPEDHPRLATLSEPHLSLRRIGLRGITIDKLYPDKPSQVTRHLKSFNSVVFPSLEVVRAVSFLVEGSIDDLARDIFIWWTERFERDGIDFQDGEGVLWMYTDPVRSSHSKTFHTTM